MRVHELAKEYGIKSTDFVDIVQSFGIDVKSHLSGLDDDQVASIRQKHIMGQVAIRLENELQERKKEEDLCTITSVDAEILREEEMIPLPEPESEDTSSLVLEDLSDDLPEDVEEEPKTEEFNGVEVDEQLNPVDEMEDGETEVEEQKEMTSAKKETEDATEAWSSMKELARQDDDAEWTKNVTEAEERNKAKQEVIVEKSKGFWGWLKSIVSWWL